MSKYRKKPVVIEAIQWDGQNIEDALTFLADGHKDFAHLPNNGAEVSVGIGHVHALGQLSIPTLEGDITASAGDFIIKGVQGEFYPCKPDIFAETYEAVEEAQ